MGCAVEEITTIFDRYYSTDEQAEGQAVSWAVATGAWDELQQSKHADR